MKHVNALMLSGRAAIVGLALVSAPFAALASDSFAIEGYGFVTAADVRQHNRLPLDLAEIRQALTSPEPDFAAALQRYAYGGGFAWRDSFHSLAFFADDYNHRMARSLPGAVGFYGEGDYAHRQIVAALMGTGEFRGGGGQRSQPEAVRAAFVIDGALATILNWCRLELSEASIRGPVNGNWSLRNGSPKNWSELFAFWYGPDGEHSLHAEMTRIHERFSMPEEPTRLVTGPLAAGQEILLEERWPREHAEEVRRALDLASLALLLDRLADLEAASEEQRDVALASLRGVWIAGVDTIARADPAEAGRVDAQLRAGQAAEIGAVLRRAIEIAIVKLGFDAALLGTALES
ncbi:MAG: hypothetical protein EA385_01855 [Salinarimonadaceae bacterium]|nr:MAG: hypothetical protein EA385_01855 [Salinarimonadaceae bacterium]